MYSPTRHFLRRTLTAALICLSLLLAACGGSDDTVRVATDDDHGAATTTLLAPSTDAAELDGQPASPEARLTDVGAVAAHLVGPVDVRVTPESTAGVLVSLADTTEFGSPTILGVVGGQDGWLEVQVPVRPNGSTGWIPAEAAQLQQIHHEVRVDLAARSLSVFDDDVEVLRSPVAVGSAENPTPTGRYFITDLLATGDPASAYGPFAFGLSGFSETLTEFAGGDGRVGIHGTNEPDSIGSDVSHGCVRLPNDVVAQLAELLPLGTPVVIV